jgi:hypothetical protein
MVIYEDREIIDQILTQMDKKLNLKPSFFQWRVKDFFHLNCCVVELITGLKCKQTYEEFLQFSKSDQTMNIFGQKEYWEKISSELKEAVSIIFALLPEGVLPIDSLDSLAIFSDCS